MAFKGLAPGFLLAAPRLGDPNFSRTVVLLARHEPEGALGWVLNGRDLGAVGELLRGSDLVPEGLELPASPAFARQARLGGPVSPATAWILYRKLAGAPSLPNEIDVGADMAVSGDVHALDAVMRGSGPGDFTFLLGYAGWGPGQLEAEVREGAWLPTPTTSALVFDTPTASLWDEAYREMVGAPPAAFTSTRRGSA